MLLILLAEAIIADYSVLSFGASLPRPPRVPPASAFSGPLPYFIDTQNISAVTCFGDLYHGLLSLSSDSFAACADLNRPETLVAARLVTAERSGAARGG